MYKTFSEDRKKEYKNILQAIGSFSYLFSESENVYLNYRVHENSYCQAFEAKNLARSDIAIDATVDNIGVGLKTFLRQNNNTYQKVAEFNKLSQKLDGKSVEEAVELIKKWRNDRLDLAMKLYDLDDLVYHCLVRDSDGFHIYEEKMKFIGKIENLVVSDSFIKFNSNGEEYNYNKSKSTLLKKFHTVEIIDSFNIKPLENPFEMLKDFEYEEYSTQKKEEIVLPLYSIRSNKVHEHSGLNQWNAKGRIRNFNEIYIPIPAKIRNENSNFFPSRDETFVLELPNKKRLSAKICQEGGKALMSNPNKDLGKWLLRDILNLKKGELLTMEILEEKGFDSILIKKVEEKYYQIDVLKNRKENIS